MLGGYPVTGGVVRLCEDADVTLRLGIAEGIEKALSIATSHQRDLGYTEQVWSALSAGTMENLPVVPGIETLAIYGDKNEVGRKAAAKLKKRWLDAGRPWVWYDAGNGELRPGKGGISLRVGKLPELYAAIGKALEAAKAEDLLESSR